LKWGFSKRPARRYTKKELSDMGNASMRIIDEGDGNYIRDEELHRIKTDGGPLNREHYSSSRKDRLGALALPFAGCEAVADAGPRQDPWWKPLKEGIEFVDPSLVGAGRAISEGLSALATPLKDRAVRSRARAFERWISADQ
jgi:hypothetical protein